MQTSNGVTIGIVGLGTMGLGIAQVFAAAGFCVIATDAYAPACENAMERMAKVLESRVSAGKLTPEARDATLSRLTIAELAAFAPCDLVIEAIIEKTEAKQALFAELETILRPDAILATNTSSIPVARIAAAALHPDRILALHFFNPPTAMKLVELAPHRGTAPLAVDRARAITEAAGKTVVECRDRPGFIVNRCARPFYGEALALLEEGHPAAEIDAAMMAAGYRLGPFALIDLVGADINLAATMGLYQAMDQNPRYYPFKALQAQVASGHLGRKTGQGFLFPTEVTAHENPAIQLRIEATLLNEAAWLLSEGGTSAQGIDTAMRLGLNFPRGPFEALAIIGKTRVLDQLAQLAAKAPDHLRARYLPAAALLEA